MDDDQTRIQQASEFFYHLVANNEKRLENGLAERDRIKKQLANGDPATGYRAAWLRKSSNRIIALLQEIASEFDAIYIQDRFSALDLIDCLITAKRKIENNIDGNAEDE